ncbi:Malate synthase-like [Homarus americanus]|uniref:malate synthase n=1 Tax=Homarus americanus TaxID=6706 RepID=A0A8J5K138_HOMAM|nr:Malate synthase-like [Homarus americanus]
MAMADVRMHERLQVIRNHLILCSGHGGTVRRREEQVIFAPSSVQADVVKVLQAGLANIGVTDVEVEPPPRGLEKEYATLLTPAAVKFVADLTKQFNNKVDLMLKERIRRKVELDINGHLPNFSNNPKVQDESWRVAPVPRRLVCRQLDLGDVSPANTDKFLEALKCDVNGIQTDFDDGHCPTWRAQLCGLHNVYKAVFGLFPGLGDISQVPVLMLRPRAWNMIEHNMMVDGKEVPGPLFDFGLLMFHCAKRLLAAESGPYFYLSKLEGANEARVWNEIFCWTQEKLNIPQGTIKACVLIENILASFEMEEILYELRNHSLGLNCGIWDYSASFVNKFGHRSDFILPDRNKYVNMQRHFLRSYMNLVIQICHRRGAHATGGMAANIMVSRDIGIIANTAQAKVREVFAGVDGFMVYDVRLIPVATKVLQHIVGDNQIDRIIEDVHVGAGDLLEMPSAGLKHNVAVGILFIDAWLQGKGHYIYKAAVEDSATAEISRSQVWQWIRHRATLEDNGEVISRGLVQQLIKDFIDSTITSGDPVPMKSDEDKERLRVASEIFEEVVTKREFPEFLTTYLNLDHTFLSYQNKYSE